MTTSLDSLFTFLVKANPAIFKQEGIGFSGTVAVSTDPGVYTPIADGNRKKRKQESNLGETMLSKLNKWLEKHKTESTQWHPPDFETKHIGSSQIKKEEYPFVSLSELNLAKEDYDIDISKAKIIQTPKGSDGKFAPEKVPTGASVWISVSNPESPLRGRHILLTKRPDGLLAITGGAGYSEAIEARRHLIFGGTPRKTKRDKEIEEEVDEAVKYNEPLLVERRRVEREARQEIREAVDKLTQALGVQKIDKKFILEKKDELQKHIEDVLGEKNTSEAKRITDNVVRQSIIAERQIGQRVQEERELAFARIGKRLETLKDVEEVEEELAPFLETETIAVPLPDISSLEGLSPQQQELKIAEHFDDQVSNFFDETKIKTEPSKDILTVDLGKTVQPLEIKSVEHLKEVVNDVKQYWDKRHQAEEITKQIKRIPKTNISPSTIASVQETVKNSGVPISMDEIEKQIVSSQDRWTRNERTLAFYDAVSDFWDDDKSLVDKLTSKDHFDSTMQWHVNAGASIAIAAIAKDVLDLRLDTGRLIEASNIELAASVLARKVYSAYADKKDATGYDEMVAKMQTFNASNQAETERRALERHGELKQQYDVIQRQKATGELLDKVKISDLEADNIIEQRKNLGAALGSMQASATVLDTLTRLRTKPERDDIIRIRVGNNKEEGFNLQQRLRLSDKRSRVDTSDPDDIAVLVGLSSLEKHVTEENNIKAKIDKYEKIKTDMSGTIEDDEGKLIVEKFDVPGWRKQYVDEAGQTKDYHWRVEQRNDINWLLEATKKEADNPTGEGGGLVTRVVGAGKTNTSLGFFAFQMGENPDYKALAVVPKGRTQQWVEEARKFTDLNVEAIPEGIAKDKIDELLAKSKKGTIYVIGHREAARAHDSLHAMQLNPRLEKFHGIVIDEPQELQARGQSGNIGELGKRIMKIPMQHRIALTATPARRNPVEAYDLIKWSSGAKDLGSKASFRRIFSGFGGGTNAQDTAIRNMYFKTIQPYISGDRMTTPDFKVKRNDVGFSRSQQQIAEQRRIEGQSESFIRRRSQEIIADARANPNHPLRRGATWEFNLSRRAGEAARKELALEHSKNIDDGDFRTNSKLLSFRQELEKAPNQKHVVFIDSMVQRQSIMQMLGDMGMKPNQIKNIAATTTSITGAEMAARVKAFRKDPNVNMIMIDKASSSGYNLQNGDFLHVIGAPQDASVLAQMQGRLARMPRKGDVNVMLYKYNDNPTESAHWNNLEAQLRVLKAAAPAMVLAE